jgi:hypothetical protein
MPIQIHDNLRDDVQALAKKYNDIELQLAKLDPHNLDNASAIAKLQAEADETRRLFNLAGGNSASIARDKDGKAIFDPKFPPPTMPLVAPKPVAVAVPKPVPVPLPPPTFVPPHAEPTAQAPVPPITPVPPNAPLK